MTQERKKSWLIVAWCGKELLLTDTTAFDVETAVADTVNQWREEGYTGFVTIVFAGKGRKGENEWDLQPRPEEDKEQVNDQSEPDQNF